MKFWAKYNAQILHKSEGLYQLPLDLRSIDFSRNLDEKCMATKIEVGIQKTTVGKRVN